MTRILAARLILLWSAMKKIMKVRIAGHSNGDNHAAYRRPEPKTTFMYPSVWVIRKNGMMKGKT